MRQKLNPICKKYKIKLMILFGSAVKNKTNKQSDIDIAISRDKELSLKQELQLRHELSRIFKRSIDLVDIKKASPLLLGEIARNSKLLVGSKSRFTSLCVYAMMKYIDFAPYFKLRDQILQKHFS